MVQVQWDYTKLAQAYLKRPDYAPEAIQEIIAAMNFPSGSRGVPRICDVGAGVAHLTLHFAERGYRVDAVEPNDSMRALGEKQTEEFPDVAWFDATGEETGRKDGYYDIVSFGSSFNVVDRTKALQEANRIGKDGAVFAALWNHRKIDDPIQKEIESIIKHYLPDYAYGSRRADQSEFLEQSGLVTDVKRFLFPIEHTLSKADFIEAWSSHATLQRQAGNHLAKILDDIKALLAKKSGEHITVPYETALWTAYLKGL